MGRLINESFRIMSQPIKSLVTVILPAYNSANYIADTVECLLSQTYKAIEIIVINDGSTDSTLDVLTAYSDTGKIKLIDQKNTGVAAARNVGISMAQGEYIAFIDSDDYWFSEKLSTQVRYLEQHSEVGAVYAAWHEWRPDVNGIFPSPLSMESKSINLDIDPTLSGWIYIELLFDCVIHTSSIMIRSPILCQLGGFDANLVMGEDYDLWLRLSRTTKIDKLSTPLSLYKIHAESLTQKKPLAVCYQGMVIERAIKEWGYKGPDGRETSKHKIRFVLANIYFNFFYQHYKQGDKKFAILFALKKRSMFPVLFTKLYLFVLNYFKTN